jgi:hypothetical protein
MQFEHRPVRQHLQEGQVEGERHQGKDRQTEVENVTKVNNRSTRVTEKSINLDYSYFGDWRKCRGREVTKRYRR